MKILVIFAGIVLKIVKKIWPNFFKIQSINHPWQQTTGNSFNA